MMPWAPGNAAGETPAPDWNGHDPVVSVIVTNHNYGHFLGDCLDSVLGQTRAAAEILVVDDHSGDGSDVVFERYADAVTVLRTAARGQAAAFNLGFKRARGSIVLFLDADDLLHPEALEVALAHWSDDLALLSYGLETIDLDGRSTGLHPYSLAADEGDNRPRLLRSRSVSGPFLFSPTTGNLFGRPFLEAVLPMPEARWRICADAYLVRAAALWGRSRALRRVLGRYRVHGANNYTRADSFDAWSMQRCRRDLEISADALDDLSRWRGLPGPPEERAAVRLALRLRALETRANVAVWTGEADVLRAQARRAALDTLAAPLPVTERMAAAAAMIRFGRVAANRGQMDPMKDEARLCPRHLIRSTALDRRLGQIERPRSVPALPFGVIHEFGQHGPHQNALADGWTGRSWDGNCYSLGQRAALEFTLPPATGTINAELCLGPPDSHGEAPLHFRVDVDGCRVWVGTAGGQITIPFGLERDPYVVAARHRIEIACETDAGRWWRPRARPQFRLVSLRLDARPADAPEPRLEPGRRLAFSEIANAAADGWEPQPDGSAVLARAQARLRLAFEPGAVRFDLVLVPRAGTPPGWLRIRAGDQDLFHGEPRPGVAIRLRLPEPMAFLGGRVLALDLAFTARDDDASGRLGFAEATLIARDLGAALGPGLAGDRPLALAPGQTVFTEGNPCVRELLGPGWDDPDEAGVRTTATEAVLRLAPPRGLGDASSGCGFARSSPRRRRRGIWSASRSTARSFRRRNCSRRVTWRCPCHPASRRSPAPSRSCCTRPMRARPRRASRRPHPFRPRSSWCGSRSKEPRRQPRDGRQSPTATGRGSAGFSPRHGTPSAPRRRRTSPR
jgi:hypothetical protein